MRGQFIFFDDFLTVQLLPIYSADDSVRKIFDLEFASRREQGKKEMAEMVELYRRQEGDTGSIEVQGEPPV